MFRFKKEWDVVWKGHRIVARNWWDILLRTGGELIIDGAPVQQKQGWCVLSGDMSAEIGSQDGIHKVRVHMGNIDWGTRVGCQIFIDDQLAGGDINKKFLT